MTLAVLEEDRKGTEERIKLTEDTLKTTKESFLGAEQQFKDAGEHTEQQTVFHSLMLIQSRTCHLDGTSSEWAL